MPAGRPRAFDIDKALDAALCVFWKHGYEGASLPQLTKAMGINRPSMYAAFGNKESLFKKALDRYAQGPACAMVSALEEPTARAVAQKVLLAGIDLVTNPSNPGCLQVHGALACAQEADAVRKEMATRRIAYEARLAERFERARKQGDLPKSANPRDLARYISTISQGMAVQAASGACKDELLKVAEIALSTWPSK